MLRIKIFFNPSRSEEKVVSKCIYKASIIYELKACKNFQLNFSYIFSVLIELKLFNLERK